MLLPEPGSLDILYEEEGFLIINKPSGILSQPNPGHTTGSILNRVISYGIKLEGGSDPNRPGLVHRLDRDTSGILILSKNQETYTKLQDCFKQRSVKKCYHFLAHGKIKRMEYSNHSPLGRHPKKRNTRIVTPDGKEAHTHFKLIKMYGQKYSLWEAKPTTGRTHQIRVHAKNSNFDILGDPHYANKNSLQGLQHLGITRTMLHAFSIQIKHPHSDQNLYFEAPYPQDFKDAAHELEKFIL